MEKQEKGASTENEVRNYNGLKLTLCEQCVASRSGKYVLVIENPQNPGEHVEVSLGSDGTALSSMKFRQDGSSITEEFNQNEIDEYLKQFYNEQ